MLEEKLLLSPLVLSVLSVEKDNRVGIGERLRLSLLRLVRESMGV